MTRKILVISYDTFIMFLYSNIVKGLMVRTLVKFKIRILSIKKQEDWAHIMENHLLSEDFCLLSIEKPKSMIGIVKLGMKTIKNIHMRFSSKYGEPSSSYGQN